MSLVTNLLLARSSQVYCDEMSDSLISPIQDQKVTNSPDWTDQSAVLTDIEDNEHLQFTMYHNSPVKPHLPVAHMDLPIASMREHLDKEGVERMEFTEKFPAGGLIKFEISMDESHSSPLKREGNVVKMFPKKGHKFRKHYFEQLTSCHHCKNLIWGLTLMQQKALRCEVCKIPVHKKCYQRLLEDCVLAKKLNPGKQKKEIKLRNPHTFKNTQV